MTKFSWKDFQFLDLINHKVHEVDNLPTGVSVSTMCCSAKIGSEIKIDNIMNFDLTWRQKRVDRSMHLSIIAGLTIVSLLSQVI